MPLILVVCLGWVAGLWAASIAGQPAWAWLLLSGMAGGGLYALRRSALLRRLLVVVLALGLAAARYEASRPQYDESFLATYNEAGEVMIEGVVWDEPDERETRTNLRVQAESVYLPGAEEAIPVRGLALVYAPRYSTSRLEATGDGRFHYGDRLRISGQLETPPAFDDFSYRDYLARQGVYSQIRLAQVTYIGARQANPLAQLLFDFKARALEVLARIFPEPQASLLQGILLGVEAGIPADLQQAFSLTGTSHIVAISGFNIAVLVSLLAAIAHRLFGPRRGTVLAIAGIAGYTLLVGAGASVVRAAIMGGLALIAGRLGRRALGLNTLAASVIAMTLIHPLTLWDVGFQLSVAATLGLVTYAEPFERACARWLERLTTPQNAARLTTLVGEVFLLTLAAQITTLPLIAYYFRSVSLISLLANLVILPAQPAVMITGGIALVLGLTWLPLGTAAAWAAWPFSTYTVAFVELFAKVPGAAVGVGDFAAIPLILFYVALFGLSWVLARLPEQRPGWVPRAGPRWIGKAALAGLSVGTFIVWSWFFSLPEAPGRLRVTVLDVGQGDAVLIQTPSGVRVLVDGGPSSRALARALAGQLPLFTRRLDLLVVAAPRDENIAGLADLWLRYDVRRALVTGAPGKSATYRSLIQAMTDARVDVVSAADLPALDLGDGVTLRVLADGERGSTLRLEWLSVSYLLPIGLDVSGESALLARGLVTPATVLLLADHGSDAATQEHWVWAADPRVVFISVGAGNAYGHPSAEVLRRLAGRTVLRTDEHGHLTLITDGARLWVETER